MDNYTLPTNCGLIPNGGMVDVIQGPLERDYIWGNRPPHEYPRFVIEAHMENVYAAMGGTKDTLPSDQYLWPAPSYNTFFVRVVLELPLYLLVVEFYHSTGQYTCYGVVDRTHTIIAVHHIYGTGNLLSIVQMVREYCDREVWRYVQCPTCWYCSRDLKHCGQGLEMNTGICNHHKGRPLVPPLRWIP